MSKTVLITTSDDRSGRKGGQYEATQRKMEALLSSWVEQKHYTLPDFIDCDPLMVDTDPGKNGRVYKPWSIKQELSRLEMGDFLIYNDCSPELWPDSIDLSLYDLDILRGLTRKNQDFLVGFVKWDSNLLGPGDLGKHTHHNFTLDSCIRIMNGERYRHSYLCASGMICIRKTAFTVGIVDRWLYYNRIPECSCMNVSEHENDYWDGKPGYKLGNRHDQSVLSMVLNKEDAAYCDIVYNNMNPYNFLNFCIPGHDYNFIGSNPC